MILPPIPDAALRAAHGIHKIGECRAIQKAVLAHFPGITLERMTSADQTKRLARARWIAMYLCHEMTSRSSTEIGRKFNRDHSTVLYGLRKIKELIAEDKETAFLIEKIKLFLRDNA